ncbi:ABC transporter ATP-binding protein [Pseudonocardia acaciae]|uniref:ABC transporter ATP-binding protein n=1 Tax=Pseudonocardia acaciae TaxID=551276 RepID=UPI0007E8D3AA|nr:ABC transporter ATP-binding protein [Pseudonocardia acaciae]
MEPLLQVRDVSSGYDGSTVLNGAELTVNRGEVVALLGRNGVGKTTLISTIMGFIRPSAGEIVLGGTRIDRLPVEKIAGAGVGLVPQGRRIFPDLTVEECLRISVRRRQWPGVERWTVDKVYDLLPRLKERAGNRGDQLSGGEQQMLAIGRALLGNPRLILMDEPSDGLAPTVTAHIADTLTALSATGLSALLVEQDLRTAFGAASRICVLEKGAVVHESSVAEFRRDPVRAKALLGIGSDEHTTHGKERDDMSTSALSLPPGFADLEEYAEDWALPTQRMRNDKRTSSTIEELDAFYNVVLPRVQAIAAYVDRYPLSAMPAHAVRLLDLARMLMEIAPAVEVMRSPDVVCDYPRERLVIHDTPVGYTLAPDTAEEAQA